MTAAVSVTQEDRAAIEAADAGMVGELRGLLENATPGPWRFVRTKLGSGSSLEVHSDDGPICRIVPRGSRTINRMTGNAALITFLRNNAEALLSTSQADGWRDDEHIRNS